MIDPVALLQDLIRCPSVTPAEGGALTLLKNILEQHGFECHLLTFSDKDTPDIQNLFAKWGNGAPHICFAGHTDVVPVGAIDKWSFDPFGGEIRDGYVCGRGAADMKNGVAAGIAAALSFIKEKKPKGTISFLITGDEEGPAINGTKKLLDWAVAQGEKIDFCILGEPTSRAKLGDTVKIGRRGTLTGKITITGAQGHVAYPHLADNPIPRLLTLLKTLDDLELDQGTAYFQPSNLEIVTIDVGNPAENIIPERGQATFNVRFNDTYTGQSLEKKLRQALDTCGHSYSLDIRVGGESFYTAPGKHSDSVVAAILEETGITAELSTAGGTSDARFIRAHCPVIEFGLVGDTMHKIDERVPAADVAALARIYTRILAAWFGG
jgi:succinyl-diaminopimelate desuccinylase